MHLSFHDALRNAHYNCIKPCPGSWARLWGRIEFSGAALFTVLVKGAGFFFYSELATCKKKIQMGICSVKRRMDDK
jgi:hypothetical protein